jgi:hypothetical protein
MAILFGCNAVLAVIAGFIGYFAASHGWVGLAGPIAESLPREKHIPYLVDLWAHNASYLGGCAGAVILMVCVWRGRASHDRLDFARQVRQNHSEFASEPLTGGSAR